MRNHLNIFILLLVVLPCYVGANVSSVLYPNNKGTIKSINIHGNKVTKTKIIKLIFGLKEGDLYDSSRIAFGESCLESTNLFSKTDVFTLQKEDGPHIYIMLTEKIYFLPYNFGGELYDRKYGKHEVWWRAKLGVEHVNFRGKMERFNISVSFWDARSVALSWYKPILPSKFFVQTGAFYNYYPDLNQHSNNISTAYYVSGGYKILKNSHISLSLQPSYNKETFRYGKYYQPDLIQIFVDTFKTYELYSELSWLSDFRSNSYDPSHGWYLSSRLKSNFLYSGNNNKYLQFSMNFRFYHHGFFSKDKFAYRFGTIIRNTDADRLYWLYYGDAGTIRGYNRSTLGNRSNNGILFGMEYKFPIYEFQPLRIPTLKKVSDALTEIRYHVDGALIFDYGRLSRNFRDLISFDQNKCESGTGVGFGLRVIAPDFARSVCCDLVWGKDLNSKWNDLKFYKPITHLYLDMYY